MPAERTAAANTQLLRQRLFERLLKERPRAVLDVGCGAGALLRCGRSAGLAMVGLETRAEPLAGPVASGLACVLGDGQALPFPDGALPWVVVRHALHHMADPQRALEEAVRVARVGVVLAEPWRPLGLPEQDLARELDAWLRRQERLAGQAHGDDLPAGQLVAWLDALGDWRLSVEHLLERAVRPLAEVRADLERGCAELPPDHPERHLLDQLLVRAAEDGVGVTGTVIVTARRAG